VVEVVGLEVFAHHGVYEHERRDGQPQELTFICGKHLATYRGEHYIRTLFSTQAELTIMLFAAVTLAAPDLQRVVQYTLRVGATGAQPLGQLVVHLVNHGTHHRAETGLVLDRIGRSPGDFDYVLFLGQLPGSS
jgi:uncharacterized damage-inducible protein DinB